MSNGGVLSFRKAFASSFVKRVRKAGSDLMSRVPSRVRIKVMIVYNSFDNVLNF